ncbi:D-amino acid dehydrogenase small subunit [Collimonas arenae]|uniref:D-amino acid dehydrogenase small subunit n=1 Tax=Collimonas arenae TaxID=279058 RepID=A0A0A1FAC0_9BURK|nr:D-amino acid dehydrogenase [Collimonas arenae]AIY39757.1 D-amino acid dehydrogenase small subunit [Collimonas arenae]
MHICVLGAGIIGVTSAYRLLEAGHQVTLVDAAAQPGSQTSLGNGAQLSYSYVAPLADPSVWTHWPEYLFSAASPLTLRPKMDTAQWRWLLKFLAACNGKRVRQTTIDLLRLSFYSRAQLQQLSSAIPLDFQHRTAGKLVMYADAKGLEGARRQIEFQAQHGCQQEIIDAARCLQIEPALASAKRDWAGGVYTASEEAGDCALFCQQLVTAMLQQPGFRFAHSQRINKLEMRDGALTAIYTSDTSDASDEKIDAEAFVLALGAESASFARQAGFTLPLYPLKGYSITVPLNDAASQAAAPQVSITDLSRKIVYARLGNRLRVAGRVELVGMDRSIPATAIDELKRGVSELFPGCAGLADNDNLSPWAGFRPATPSGVPIIGASPVKNLYLNIGHGSLGWTLAHGSASLLTQLIAGKTTAIDASPFSFSG